MRIIAPLIGLICLFTSAAAQQQQIPPAPTLPGDEKLARLIGGVFRNLVSPLPPELQAIAPAATVPLNSASFNTGLAAAVSNLPAASSASAFRYVLNPATGTYQPTAQSLGPVLTERAETIGKDRVYFAVTHQRFQFTQQDGVDTRLLRVTFPVPIPPTATIPVATTGIIDAAASNIVTVSQTTALLTYGVTRWLDASFALPMMRSSVDFEVEATLASAFLPQPIRTRGTARGSATGLGDGVARIKAKFFDRKGLAMAMATDFRLPIGDELDFHGAGAYGVKPFLIASYTRGAISPHVNAGFQWNGNSLLASRATDAKEKLPNQAFFAVGGDVAMSKRATFAFDLLDQIVLNGPRLRFLGGNIGAAMLRIPDFPTQTRHELNGSAGFKIQVRPDIVLAGNLLFRLNDAGLRARVVPFLGLSYLF